MTENCLENITTTDDKYFTFWLNMQQFAIPISNVVQIVGLLPLTPIPESPHYLKGILNVRGSLIPTIDLRAKFCMPETENADKASVIIVTVLDKQVSIIVDNVSEVANIPKEEYAQDQGALGDYLSDYITHVSVHNGHIVLHLDPLKLFDEDIAQYA